MKRFSIVTAKLAGYGLHLVPIHASSALAAWAYDSSTQVFEVVFHSGVVKRYRLPIPTVQAFIAARSKGSFYNRKIKRIFRDGEVVAAPSLCNQVPESDCSRSQRSQTGNPEARLNLQGKAYHRKTNERSVNPRQDGSSVIAKRLEGFDAKRGLKPAGQLRHGRDARRVCSAGPAS